MSQAHTPPEALEEVMPLRPKRGGRGADGCGAVGPTTGELRGHTATGLRRIGFIVSSWVSLFAILRLDECAARYRARYVHIPDRS
jgi:hypothetical protein